MSCKKDRNLQAAIALGLLWGMGQSAGANKETLEGRALRVQALVDYMGVHLPIKAEPPDTLWIGDEAIQPTGQGWLCTVNGNSSLVSSYETAISSSVLAQTIRPLAEFLPSFPQDAKDKESLSEWLLQFQQAVTGAGQVLEGTGLEVSLAKSEMGDSYAAKAYFADELGADPKATMVQWDNAPINALFLALYDLVQRRITIGKQMEPFLGIFQAKGFTDSLLNNGFFNVAYLDEHTAQTVGGQLQQGWYIVRDNQPYKGPLKSPAEAALWVKAEWGDEIEKYALIAQINDQYRVIRDQHDLAVAKVKNQLMSAKAQQTALKTLDEQLEFQARSLADPYILSEKNDPHVKGSKLFRLQGPEGKRYEIKIVAPTKKTPAVQWYAWEILPDNNHKYVLNGSTIGNPSSEKHRSTYDALLFVVKRLAADGVVIPCKRA